jgi:hypothetical protein
MSAGLKDAARSVPYRENHNGVNQYYRRLRPRLASRMETENTSFSPLTCVLLGNVGYCGVGKEDGRYTVQDHTVGDTVKRHMKI